MLLYLETITMKIATLQFLFTFAFCIPCFAADEDLEIDNFYFVWTLAESGDAKFQIYKDGDSTRAVLADRFHNLKIKPQDAESIAKVLARTEDFYKKLGGGAEKSEAVVAGEFEINFRNTDKGKFYISVSEKKGSIMNRPVALDRAQAKALAKPMQRAVKAAALVDQKVKI